LALVDSFLPQTKEGEAVKKSTVPKPEFNKTTLKGSRVMSSSKKSTLISTIAVFLALVAINLPSSALADSAAGDFSITNNPNGVWSYGYSSSLGAAFTQYSSNITSYQTFGIDGWLTRISYDPYLLYNDTSKTITNQYSVYQPGQLILQSGQGGQYSIVRWTAPFSGQFSIAATFSGLSRLGDSSDVHILLDGVSIFASNVNGSPSPQSYSGTKNLVVGDIIDFASGVGSDGSENEDNTALSAIITVVPEPSTVLLTMGGLLTLFCVRRRNS
jgi:hypothetical protein